MGDAMSDDEFGPLIIHDGRHVPPVGTIVKVFFEGKGVASGAPKGAVVYGDNWAIGMIRGVSPNYGSWLWLKGYDRILSYRIKKSDGFKLLEKLVSDPPDMLIEDKQLETV